MRFLKIIFIFIFLGNYVYGQNITGKTTDANGKTLPFVNIGIPLKNIGTISDADGFFSLRINKNNINDTLYFSMLGYKTSAVPIKKILNNNLSVTIKLKQITYKIGKVIVNPKKYRFKTFGNTFNDKNRMAGYRINKLGNEIGVLMKNNKAGIIGSVAFNIAECSYDTLFLRLNIYEFKDKQIGQNILKQPYYIKLSKEEIDKSDGAVKLDLNDLHLKINGNFLVSLETVITYSEPDGFYFCDGIFSTATTYSRETSFGKWYKGIFYPAINATVKYEK